MAYIGFKDLVNKLKGNVEDPAAVAASVGKKKYGVDKFSKHAKRRKKMKGVTPLKKKKGP